MKSRKGKNKNFKNGFTLVETLVAISILSLSILGAFTAVQSGLQKSIYTKDQITAFYLAQEVMEYVRNVRDENAIASINSISSGGSAVNWLHGLSELSSDSCYFGKVCMIDSPLDTVTYCGTTLGSCPVLKQSPTSFLFGYTSGWTNTHFKREVQFQQVKVGVETMVIVTISWDNHSFQVEQLFTNNR